MKHLLSTKKIFRQINSLVSSLVKTLVSRNFCQKSVKVNFCNYHTMSSGQDWFHGKSWWRSQCRNLIIFPPQFFAQINVFTKYLYCMLVWRKNFQVVWWGDFWNYHTVLWRFNSRKILTKFKVHRFGSKSFWFSAPFSFT